MRYRATAKPAPGNPLDSIGDTSGKWLVEIIDEGRGGIPDNKITKIINNLTHEEAVAKVNELNKSYLTREYSG